MTGRLADRHAIIFGAGALRGVGNGSAAALRFARDGARVSLVDRDRAAVEACADLLHAEGLDGHVIVADVTDGADVDRAFAEAEHAYGPVDILHNNVGITRAGGVIGESEADWHLVLTTNLTSAFLTMKRALPSMIERKTGAIVNVSSVAGSRYTGYDYAGYSASKAGLEQLTRVTALQHAADGVRVNAVVPGIVDTQMVREQIVAFYDSEAEMLADRNRSVPTGKTATPWDVAAAAVFLASDDAAQITGHCLPVDGGLSLQIGLGGGNKERSQT